MRAFQAISSSEIQARTTRIIPKGGGWYRESHPALAPVVNAVVHGEQLPALDEPWDALQPGQLMVVHEQLPPTQEHDEKIEKVSLALPAVPSFVVRSLEAVIRTNQGEAFEMPYFGEFSPPSKWDGLPREVGMSILYSFIEAPRDTFGDFSGVNVVLMQVEPPPDTPPHPMV